MYCRTARRAPGPSGAFTPPMAQIKRVRDKVGQRPGWPGPIHLFGSGSATAIAPICTAPPLTAGSDGNEVGIAERCWFRAGARPGQHWRTAIWRRNGNSVGPGHAADDSPPGADQLNAKSELRADRANEGEPGHLD
jgi:hypothetical protein